MEILHLAVEPDVEAARPTGSYQTSSRGVTLADAGFIHACTAAQLAGVVARFYADVPGPVRLLVMDTDDLTAAGSPVRWDAVPPEGHRFPHIYGPVPFSAVRREIPGRIVDEQFVAAE